MSIRTQVFFSTTTALALIVSLNAIPLRAQTDFVTAVTSTHPLAFYRLDSTSGQSQVGATTYQAAGGVGIAASGAPVANATSRFLKLDGRSAKITTTQMGGVGATASIMAWVNLADLPSKVGHIFYVAGESENGNDLDLQIEPDNVLRFFTAAGGNLPYTPPPATLLNQWHQIVATLDTATHTRVIYWDGKSVATDKGGGEAGKKAAFTIGESSVFTGRFFKGSIDDVALWNRALKPAEVTAIYTASNAAAPSTASAPSAPSTVSATPTTGPFATTAKVDIEDAAGKVQLKREEQIAYMFLSAIEVIEHNCQLTLQHVCTLDQMLTGSYPKGSNIEHLKFDPNKTDPNYTYTVAAGGMAWEAHANAKRPGLIGFCFMARNVGTTTATYSTTGKSGWVDKELGNRGMEGDSFASQ
ncbi:MAG: LamG domain-containing protein [Terracidiphilus sp.]